MSKNYDNGSKKGWTIFFSSLGIVLLIVVIGLIFYPQIKDICINTIPTNMQQIKDDIKTDDPEDKVIEDTIEDITDSTEE